MKIKFLLAAATIAAAAVSSQAVAADDGLSYDELTTCAAFVLLEAQAYDTEKATADDKATAENFYQQAAALTVAASVIQKKDSKEVTDDVKAINAKMIGSITDKESAAKLIADHKDNCNALGQAAQEALNKK
jgi:hypothetical protein